MSNLNNEIWLSAAHDNFREALDAQDWATCHNIIADVRSEYSDEEGSKMMKVLYKSQAEVIKEEEAQDALEKNAVWLIEQGRTEGDVMQDDLGNSFILAETEEGLERRYLPYANSIDLDF